MSYCCDLYLLSLTACKLGECLSDDEMNILSANLQVLGDMLSSILAVKQANENNKTKENISL
ncbi:MAG: hypothetical protein LUG24_03920 [Clostridiales bacterium]|nr:hypothetical protein [Clostridiales bacterium]